MCVTLSCSGKLKLLDKAADTSKHLLVESIKQNPQIKITGDNLDMYVRTNHQRLDNDNKDIHWFASNVIGTRLNYSGLSSEKPNVRA